jgi:cell division protein FtsX
MAARNVFVHIGNGKFYLDEEAASELIQRRRATVLAVMAVVLMLFLFIWLVSHH